MWMSLFLNLNWNLELHHLLTNGSTAVNGCRRNESPNSWRKHHNNPRWTPVHQLTLSCEVKNCMFLINTSIVKMYFFTFKPLLPSKICALSIILHSTVKVWISRESSTVCKGKQSKTLLNKNVGGFWCEENRFLHWKKHYNELWTGILARSNYVKLNW